MANASLISQRVQEIRLINKLEKMGQVRLDSGFSLNVSFVSDGSRCVATMQQTLRDKEYVGSRFSLMVEIVAVFSCTGATTDEVKRQVHGEVYDQLFPFMQVQCASLAGASGIPGLMLQKSVLNPDEVSVSKPEDSGPERNPDDGPKLTLL